MNPPQHHRAQINLKGGTSYDVHSKANSVLPFKPMPVIVPDIFQPMQASFLAVFVSLVAQSIEWSAATVTFIFVTLDIMLCEFV